VDAELHDGGSTSFTLAFLLVRVRRVPESAKHSVAGLFTMRMLG
jgi:hypothetical protein